MSQISNVPMHWDISHLRHLRPLGLLKNVADFICDFLKLKEDVLFTLLIFGAKDVENFMQRRAGEQMEQNPLMEAAAGATSQEFYTLLPLPSLDNIFNQPLTIL